MINSRDLENSFLDIFFELVKTSQVTSQTPAAIDTDMLENVAKKLVNQLSSDIGISAQNVNTELYVKDLQDLQSLVSFLYQKMIKYNGKFIVAKSVDSPEDAQIYAPYTIQSGVDAMALNDKVYIYKQGLISYLKDLEKTALNPNDPNNVLKAMVDKLINQVNSELKLGIKPEKPFSPEQKKEQPQKTQEQTQLQQVSWRPGQPLNQQQLTNLSSISNQYPLKSDMIDFRLIDAWLETFLRVISSFPSLNVGVADAQKALITVRGIMSAWQTSQLPLTDTAVDIYRDIKSKVINRMPENQAVLQPNLFLQQVAQLIISVERVLIGFKSAFYNSFPQEWKAELDQQIDDSAGSYAAINRRQTHKWLSDLPAAQKQVESGR